MYVYPRPATGPWRPEPPARRFVLAAPMAMEFADDFVVPATLTPVRRKPLGSISTNEVSKPLAAVKAAAAAVKKAVQQATTVKVWENGDGDACYLVNSTPQGSVAVYKCDHGCGFQGSFADVAEHELSSGGGEGARGAQEAPEQPRFCCRHRIDVGAARPPAKRPARCPRSPRSFCASC